MRITLFSCLRGNFPAAVLALLRVAPTRKPPGHQAVRVAGAPSGGVCYRRVRGRESGEAVFGFPAWPAARQTRAASPVWMLERDYCTLVASITCTPVSTFCSARVSPASAFAADFMPS